MKLNKIILTLAMSLLVVSGSKAVLADQTTTSSDNVSSSETQSVQTKALSQAYVVYGSGLASEDKDKINDALGVKSNYKELTATGSDYAKYINNSGTTDASMISCVSLAPADPGTGVKVNIENYDGSNNITEVTSQQYAMVATMAGVKDVIITVTADKSVSGESALTGVYKALANDGLTLDQQNTQAANSVLDATQTAINENKDNDKYPGKLMSAVGNVSADLAKQKQSDDQLATKDDIKKMLDDALEKQGIKDETSNTTINNIVVALSGVQAAPVSNTKSYVSNAKNVADSLQNSVGDKMADLKDFANSDDAKKAKGALQNIWDAIVSFFKNLF
ncbi:DUF1002 domain-containing protein [Lentilactobacillus laojiaonis]|uniref:DUF1002 domain-containing protein n=1 Tax=Lentilactobacillus laojiaonis TaxID=2883998 RepID=UPI001D0BBCAA|nr:DUF1002 domain-containing protein [Lentilactobacillus laojiaonis]UDM32552.1 DUF1002 domain-containing protein [Lentilactobacillus laojiaonis]